MEKNYSNEMIQFSTEKNSALKSSRMRLTTLIVALFLFLLAGILNVCQGQTTIYTQNFGTGTTAPSGWSTSGANAQFSTTSPSSTYSGFSAATNMADGATGPTISTAIYTSANISTVGYSAPITLTYGYRISSSLYTANIKTEYSTDGGSTWTIYNNSTAGSGLFTATGGTWQLITSQTLTGAAGISNLQLRWTCARTTTSGNFRIDDIKIQGASATPSITLSSPSQIGSGNLLQGSIDQPISNFQADVTVSSATLNTLAFVTGNGGGSYSAADITNFKLYYNATSNTFGGASQIGTTQSGVGSGSTVTFGALTKTINSGATGYFWITSSVASGATAGNIFNANASPTLTFASGTPTGSISAGGIQTIIATPATISVGALTPGSFSTVVGSASAVKTFTLTGSALTANLTVSAVSGYKYSDDGFATAGQSSLTYITASVSKTISVRLIGTTVGTYSGTITIACTGATGSPNTSISLSGTVNNPPTTLAAGDIAVIGYNTNGSPDNFAILVLKDLYAGTVFYINDNEVASAGGTSFFDLSEGEASFTVKPDQTIPAGTMIVLPWGAAGVSTSTYDFTSTSGAGLGNFNDEIYIYTAPLLTSTTPTAFIYFAQIGTSTSAVPSGLTSGSTAINPQSAALRYSTSGALYSECKTNLLSAIATTSTLWNATGAAAIAAGDWTFTVNATCTPTLLVGSISSSSFSTPIGTPSTASTFTLNAYGLSSNLTVSALAGYEYSDDGFATAGQSSLTYSTANVTKTISVRLIGTTVGTYNGNITIASAGATGSPTNISVTGSVLLPNIAFSNWSPASGSISQNTNNNILVSVQCAVTNTSATLNAVTFTTVGSYLVSDLKANGFRIWFNNTNDLNTPTQLGTDLAIVSSGNTLTVSGLSQSFPVGTSYILVTADVSYNANTLSDISIVNSLGYPDYTFALGTLSGTAGVAGNPQMFAAVTPTITITQATTSPAASNVNYPSTNSLLDAFKFDIAGNATDINSVSVTTAGTYTSVDFVANSFKLWYNTTNSFATATQIGTSQAVPSSGGTVTFSGLNQFASGAVFVWITIDAEATAINGHTINITSTPFSSLTFSQGTLLGTNPVIAGAVQTLAGTPLLTELILPQYIQGLNGTNINRVPFAYRAALSNLLPSATYRYIACVVLSTDGATSTGAGNAIYAPAGGGSFVRSSGPNLTTAGNYGTFTTDALGNYTGWFIIEPTANASRFVPGNNLYMRIVTNDGGSGTTAVNYLTTTNTAKVVNLVGSAGANNASGLRGNSFATDKNFIFAYDNVSGTGRPISGTFVESDGSANTTGNSYASFYGTSVDGVSGAYGIVIPNTNANGIQRIEQRDFSSGNILGCPATDADGIWTSGVNTVNPTSGTTALVITSSDAPLYPDVTVGGTVSSSAIVCNGSNGGTLSLTGETGAILKWQYSNDNFVSDINDIVNTTNSQAYLNLTATTSYRAVVQRGSCAIANSSVATISVLAAGVNWLGSVSTDWFNAANWCGGIPTSTTDVVISSASSNMPLINASGAVCRNITLNSGTSLSIDSVGYLTVNGDWSNSGTVTANGTVSFAGSAAQSIAGTSTFNNFELNNNSGLTLNASITINGTAQLLNGKITTGSNDVTISNGGNLNATTTSYVNGNLKKYIEVGNPSSATYEVGSLTAYTPISVNFNDVSVGAYLTVYSVSSDHPSISSSGLVATKTVNRYWNLSASGLSFDYYDADLTYVNADTDAGFIEMYAGAKIYSSTWHLTDQSAISSNTLSIANVSYLGSIQIGVFNPTPFAYSINPSFGYLGETTNIVFSGSGFISGISSVNSVSDVTINSTTINNDSTLTLNITVSPTALVGTRKFAITNAINAAPQGGTSDSLAFFIRNLPIANFYGNRTSITCNLSGDVEFNNYSTDGASYFWDFGVGASPATATGVGPYTVTYSSTGNKTVKLIAFSPIGNDTLIRTNYIAVTANVPTIPTLTTGPTSVCPGDTKVYSVPLVSDVISYNWILPSGITLVSGGGTRTITVSFSPTYITGNILISETNACGTGSPKVVTVSAAPATPTSLTGLINICSVTTATYTVSTVVGAVSYTWVLPAGVTSLSGTSPITILAASTGPNTITVNFAPTFSSGSISVKANSTCGSSALKTLAITSTLAAPTLVSTSTTGLCVAGVSSATYTCGTVAGASSYLWTAPSGATITSGAGTTSVTISFGASFTFGNITVAAVNACGTGLVKTLAVRSTLIAPTLVSTSTTGLCPAGVSSATYTCGTVAGASSYLWTAPLGATITSGAGTTSVTISFGASFTSGNITVAAVNACGTGLVKTLAVRSTLIAPTLVSTSTTGLCPAGVSSETYTCGTVAGATSYTWTVPAGATITSGAGTQTVTISFGASFTYGNITVKAENACGSGLAKTLAVRSSLAAPGVVTGSTVVCANSTDNNYSILPVVGATSYIWTVPAGATITSGAGTNAIVVDFGTSVTGGITVKGVNACGNGLVRSLTLSMTCLGTSSNDSKAVTTPKFENTVDLFPNPASENLNMNFVSEVDKDVVVEIFNSLGSKVSSVTYSLTAGENSIITNVAAYNNGFYFVKITDLLTTEVLNKTFIKQ